MEKYANFIYLSDLELFIYTDPQGIKRSDSMRLCTFFLFLHSRTRTARFQMTFMKIQMTQPKIMHQADFDVLGIDSIGSFS